MPDPTVDPNVDVKPESEPSTQTPSAEGQPAAQAPSEPAKSDAQVGTPPAQTDHVPITALHEERDKRQSLQAKLDQLTRALGVTYDQEGNPVVPQAQQHQPTADTNVTAFQQELEKAWDEDPRKGVQMEINAAITWYDGVSAAVDEQMEDARGKHADFNTYSRDVARYVRQLPPAQRGNSGIVEMAYWLVKGQQVDKVTAANQAQAQLRVQNAGAATPMGAGTSSVATTPADQVQLTDEQRAAADAMGLSPEDYAAGIKRK